MSSGSSSDNQDIADRLRQVQREQGLSVEQMADRAGVPKNSLQNYMRRSGTQKPGFDAIIGICDGMGISADWLLGRTTQKEGTDGFLSAVETSAKIVFQQALTHLTYTDKWVKAYPNRMLPVLCDGLVMGSLPADLASDYAYQVLHLTEAILSGRIEGDRLKVTEEGPQTAGGLRLNPENIIPKTE